MAKKEKPKSGIVEIPVDKIEPPLVPQRTEDELRKLDELMGSIDKEGLLHPIEVNEYKPKHYRLIHGSRRLEAVKKLGWKKIPCRVVKVDEKTEIIRAMTENIQRENPNPYLLARAAIELREKHKMEPADIAMALSKSIPYVTQMLSLKNLDSDLFNWGVKGELDFQVGYRLSRVKEREKQVYYAHYIVENKMPRTTAVMWIDRMEKVKELEEAEKELIEEEAPAITVPEKKPKVIPKERCLVCGKELPTKVIKTYNPICDRCLVTCSFCGATGEPHIVTICDRCLATIKRMLEEAGVKKE